MIFVALTGYLVWTLGRDTGLLFLLMAPLWFILPELSLLSMFNKAIGRRHLSSLFEYGSIHLAIVALVLLAASLGAKTLVTAMMIGAPIFLGIGLAMVTTLWRRTKLISGFQPTQGQRLIVLNNMLNFVSLNGFPLIFAAFVAVSDLGQFRLEERLFLALMFGYMLFETVAMKRFIRELRTKSSEGFRGLYLGTSVALCGAGLLAGMAMFALISQDKISGFLGYEPVGALTILMAMSTPFYYLIKFNNTVLNLLGRHGAVSIGMVAGAALFIGGATVLYAVFGVDGLRISFLAGGVTGAVVSGILVFRLAGSDLPDFQHTDY